jgi:hypothetical protein
VRTRSTTAGFFTVNDLICLKVETPAVSTRSTPWSGDCGQGIRPGPARGPREGPRSHGLPAATARAAPEAYLVVEMISPRTRRCRLLAVQGTRVRFLNAVAGSSWPGEPPAFAALCRRRAGVDPSGAALRSSPPRPALIIRRHMGGDVDNWRALKARPAGRARLGPDPDPCARPSRGAPAFRLPTYLSDEAFRPAD